MAGAKVLTVDDNPANLNLLTDTLSAAGYTVLAATNGQRALQLCQRNPPDLILLDVTMPGMDGYEVCRRMKADEIGRSLPVIFLTAHDESEHVVRGFQAGGVDYVQKPFRAEELLARVATHLKIHRLTQELVRKNQELQAEISRREQAEQAFQVADEQLSIISTREAERWGLAAFVGRSSAFQTLVQDIRRLQSFGTASVLITGESGTGKELIARAIHYGGAKAKGPFIPVNCSAIPSELAESMLFGQVKGAFTGATADRKGCFEQAHGGTLFLDEIGDMPVPLQAKLLRVLEDGVITPVGATQFKQVQVRLVAATNCELNSAIEAGKFRGDLYYRLARFTIESPPLRERREDLPLLAEHFLKAFASEMGMAQPSLSLGALEVLEGYDYPGNVRELRNVIERALIQNGGGQIGAEHLRFLVPAAAAGTEKASQARTATEETVAELPAGISVIGEARGRCSEEEAIVRHVQQHGTINNAECRELLSVGMHRAWYLLRKLHRSGKLRQDSSGRWAQYRLP